MSVRRGRYRLDEKIGEGGMAEVWAATILEGPAPAFPVVIKQLRPQWLSAPDHVRAFVEEARLGLQLHHPCIVQVHELGETDGLPWFSMERIGGLSASELLDRLRARGEALPTVLTVALVARIAEGLHFAHELVERDTGRPLHVVHRDVSPSNILLSNTGDARIADFGIAKTEVEGRPRTRVGMTKGKLAYMSPEQARGEALDRRTDVYALGIVLWELLTGAPLFHDPQTRRMVRQKVPAPSSVRAGIAPALDALVLACLALPPQDRPPTARAIEEHLDAWLASEGVHDARRRLAALMASVGVAAPALDPLSDGDGSRASVDDPLADAAEDPLDDRTERIPLGRGSGLSRTRSDAGPASHSDARAQRDGTGAERLIGRRAELAALARAMADGTRLVTLRGPPGIGKTRLARALTVDAQMNARFPGGCFVCELSDCTDARAALHAIARGIGVTLRADRDAGALLVPLSHALDALDRCIVVLDGVDGVDAAAGHPVLQEITNVLAGVCARATHARFILTARATVGLAGEHVLDVPPLAIETGAAGEPEGGVALFIERAEQARGGRALAPALRGVVAQIARKLGGNPLAIELAAARARAEALESILLTVSPPDGSHHGTAHAIDAVVQLLSAPEQRAFAQASVFVGAFDLVAAEAVFDVIDDDVLASDALEALRACALVTRRTSDTGVRMALRAPARAVASRLLDTLGLRAATEARHAGLLVFRGRKLGARAEAGDPAALVGLLEQADDLAAVITRVTRSPRSARASRALSTLALEAAVALEPTFGARAASSGLSLLDSALTCGSGVADEPIVVRALLSRAEARRLTGDATGALDDLADALEAATRLGDVRTQARARIAAALLWLGRGQTDSAARELEDALRAARAASDAALEARALGARAKLHRLRGDLDAAVADANNGVQAARRSNASPTLARALLEHASILSVRGEHDDAATAAHAATLAFERCGDLRGLAASLLVSTVVAVDRVPPRLDDAETSARRALALAVRVGDPRCEGMALGLRGAASHLRGAQVDAREEYARASHVLEAAGDRAQAAYFLAAQAAVLAHLGDLSAANASVSAARRLDPGASATTIALFESVVIGTAMGSAAQRTRALEHAARARDSEELRFAVRIAMMG